MHAAGTTRQAGLATSDKERREKVKDILHTYPASTIHIRRGLSGKVRPKEVEHILHAHRA